MKIKEKKRKEKTKIQEPSATQISLSSRQELRFLQQQLCIYRVLKLGPNFDALLGGFQVNWTSLLILSRHRVLVATSVVSVLVAEASVLL